MNKITATLELNVKTMEAEIAMTPGQIDRLLSLAEQYHEMVYLRLASEETEIIYLSRAIELLLQAIALAPDRQAIQFLLLKCYVKGQNGPAARKWLDTLTKNHFPPELLLSWASEIQYQERDWPNLAATLRRIRGQQNKDPRLRPVVDFWLGPEPGE